MSDPVTPAARAVGFVGARALRAGDLLAGRDGELADITNLVVAERVVLLYSPSGAGKTSLLQAGLVPALRRRKQYVPLGDDPDGAAPPQFLLPDAFDPDGRPTGQPVVVRVNTPPDSDAPANRYVRSAVLALHSGLPPTVRLPDADLNGISLCEYLSRAYPSAATAPADDDPDDDPPDPSYPVLIFDQFEEALTLDPADEEDKQAFFQDLGRAAADRSRWFVFAMREDHLAELEPYLGYLPRWLAARLRIDRLKRDPAADAVKQIVDNAGYPIEKTTAEALVDKLRTLTESRADEGFKAQEARAGKQRMYPTVEPLFVQVVGLRLLTDRKPKTEVTRQDVDAIDVERVLASYFAEEVEAATGGDRQVERWTRLWFDRALLNRDGRRVSSRETEADEYGVPPEVLAWLDTRFVIRRVIEGGVVCYEIAHDRLAGAVRRDNLRWRRERLTPFERAAAVWANTAKPRPAELLVGGAVLAEGEAADRAGWLDDDETEFLVECRTRRDRTRKWRALAGLVAAAALVATVWYQARRQEEERVLGKRQAEYARSVSDARERTAFAGRLAQEQNQAANVFRLQDEAARLAATDWDREPAPRDFPGSVARRALDLLAQAGYTPAPDGATPPTRVPLPDAETALRDALQRLGRERLRVSDQPLRAVAVSRDGMSVGVGGDRRLLVWGAGDLDVRVQPVVDSDQHSVTALAFSPNGDELLFGTSDGKVWKVTLRARRNENVVLYEPVLVPKFDSGGPIRAIHYLPSSDTPEKTWADGRGWVAVAAADGSGYLWNRAGGADEAPVRLGLSPDAPLTVTALGFTPRGTNEASRRLYAGTAAGSVFAWELTPRASKIVERKSVPNAGSAVTAVAIHPRATVLAAAGYRSGLRLWNMDPDGKELTSQEPDDDTRKGFAADSLAFHPGGKFLAAGTAEQGVWLFKGGKVDEYKPAGGPFGPDKALSLPAWAFDPGGGGAPVLVGGGPGQPVRVWALDPDGFAPLPLPGSNFGATALAVTPDHLRVVGVGLDGTLRRWDLQRTLGNWDAEPRVFHGPTAAVARVAANPSGTWVGAVDENGTVSTWERSRFRPAPRPEDTFTGAAPDGPLLLTEAAGSTTVTVTAKAGGAASARVLTDPRGRWVPTAALAPAAETARPLMSWTPDGAWAVRLSPDRHSPKRLEPVVRRAADRLAGEPGKLPTTTPRLAVAPDARVVAGFHDGQWEVWHADPEIGGARAPQNLPRTGQGVIDWPDFDAKVVSAAVGPAGDGGSRYVAAGFDSDLVRVWLVRPGREPVLVANLFSHRGAVRAVAFSPDGRRLATAGADAKVRLWDLSPPDRPALSNTPVVLAGHTGEVTALAFAGAGENLCLVSGGADGTVRLWTADPVRLAARARALLSAKF